MYNLKGKKFGRLTVLERISEAEHRARNLSPKNSYIVWRCECECGCGNTVEVQSNNLRSGNTKSCGCLAIESRKERYWRHGDGRVRKGLETRLHRIWGNMKKRCSNPRAINFKSYGGKGIRVCEEWLEYLPFKAWALANGYADHLTIDRINSNGDYCPQNCQWLSKSENGKKRWREQRRGALLKALREVLGPNAPMREC